MASDNKGKNDAELTMALLIICVIGFIVLVWWLGNPAITAMLKPLRWLEWQLVALVSDGSAKKAALAKAAWVLDYQFRGELGAKWNEVGRQAREVMVFFRWPIGGVLALLGLWAAMTTPGARHRRTFDLERLLGAQSKHWPVIAPLLKFNPAKFSDRAPGAALPPRLPMFAEALNPHEWLALHRVPVIESQIDRDACRRAMVKQLGARWRGPQKLPDHQRALFAAFALKGVQKRQESDELLGEIACCWTPEKGLRLSSKLRAKIDKVIADPAIGGEAAKQAERHAFAATAMLRTLAWARERGGVLAPATFLWLRGLERRLWYPMNNLGRRAFHAEAAGAMAHYMAEIAAAKPLPTPKLDAAIMAVEDYIAAWGGKLPAVQGAPAAAELALPAVGAR